MHKIAESAKCAATKEAIVAQKNPSKNTAKTAPAKNLKEKRLEKKAKSAAKDKKGE
jgi:hypothetical protein